MPDCAVEILQCALYTLAGTAAELVRTILKDLEGIGSYIIGVRSLVHDLSDANSRIIFKAFRACQIKFKVDPRGIIRPPVVSQYRSRRPVVWLFSSVPFPQTFQS